MSFITHWHPLVTFFFYVNMLVISMAFDQPILILGAVIGSIGWLYFLLSRSEWIKNLVFYLLLALIIMVTNPLFSHRGETVLFFLNGNAVTKEAILYGAAMGGKMAAVFAYSRCFAEVFKINQFLYLFQKISPKLALLLSMAFGFVPKLKRQAKSVSDMQKAMGMYSKHGYMDQIISKIRVFDSLITWSLEQGVTTADSMNARGYGQGRRSNFTIYRFGGADKVRMFWLVLIAAGFYAGAVTNVFAYSYYPSVMKLEVHPREWIYYICFVSLAVMPICLEIKEKMKWNVLQSKM
ncbi:MAG: energy-coupling factor transporter transmembrane component T [bacterium]|nr:energy-coupling factor transporter transmembrane component T [bacterium]